ncbi:MAG TPA: benzoate-CoA ligase family protein [Candidatus Binatia bacterium]|nr:benzoate-CoA ligase family protein [Candidatus Binatia bacterium]
MISIPDTFNVASYFVDRHVLEGRGANVAIECESGRITYTQLLERTNRAGNALQNLGVRMEERVALLLPDVPEFLYSFFGAIKIGAVAVPLNTYLKAEEYQYLLDNTRARVAIVHNTLVSTLDSIPKLNLRHLEQIVVVGGEGSRAGLERLMENSSPQLAAAPTGKDDAAFWLYSSGSTGASKACIHLHHDMVVCSELYAKGILQIGDRDRCYSVARLFFAYGLGNAGYFPLSCGATTILSSPRPDVASIYANIERYRPSLFFSVPSNYVALLAHRQPDGREFDLSSIRQAVSAGESLPAAVFERFKERFGIEILDGLGSTETLQMVISNTPRQARPGSTGKVIPGYEARLVDENGGDVAPGEIGALLIKGDSTCAGYWNQHEKTKATFAGDWFRTGDKYYQDEDGYFWYAGRSDDLFKVNGRWLSPAEVEAALIAHPAVQEAAVIAREDGSRLTKPVAYVVLNDQFAPDEKLARDLQQWVVDRLGAYKRPRWIEFLPELPKTATGKLQRFKLREWQAGKRSEHE